MWKKQSWARSVFVRGWLMLCVLATACTLMSATDLPDLRVAARPGTVVVKASDVEGLATLEIASAYAESAWHTSLSGAEPMRTLERTFVVSELFPGLDKTLSSVELKITVRNTRGQSASSTVLVRLKSN